MQIKDHAKASIVFGVIGIILPITLMSIPAICFALKELTATPLGENKDKRSNAKTGLILGFIGFSMLQFFIALYGLKFLK